MQQQLAGNAEDAHSCCFEASPPVLVASSPASLGLEPSRGSCGGVDAQGAAATVARLGSSGGKRNLMGAFSLHKVGCGGQRGPTKLGLMGRYAGCIVGDERLICVRQC